jgi:hypothetical protein
MWYSVQLWLYTVDVMLIILSIKCIPLVCCLSQEKTIIDTSQAYVQCSNDISHFLYVSLSGLLFLKNELYQPLLPLPVILTYIVNIQSELVYF